MTNADRQGKTKRPADAPEREVERMQRQSEQVGERIDETRRDWENKRGDGTVAPDARPQAAADEDAHHRRSGPELRGDPSSGRRRRNRSSGGSPAARRRGLRPGIQRTPRVSGAPRAPDCANGLCRADQRATKAASSALTPMVRNGIEIATSAIPIAQTHESPITSRTTPEPQ